ncbi:hypothetical protein AB0D10_41630 [Kitasatospora sp. NPDC048545]|uniref:hypothetical protein n=1 Tax=Kitasatospora sp. NPDC048545 TaxID=3157208 RepID=UPI0033CC077F
MGVTPAQLSFGGLALSGAVLITAAIRWWRAGFPLPGVMTFLAGLLMGLLSALCTGGLLALVARNLVKATNKLGEVAAGHGSSQLLGPAEPAGLQRGGGVAVALLLAALIVVWKCCDNALRRQIGWGSVVGTSFGLAGGVSGLAAITLIPWLNHAGDQVLFAWQVH